VRELDDVQVVADRHGPTVSRGGVIPCSLAAADLSGISVRHGSIHNPCEARSKRRSPRSGTPSPLCCRTLVRAPIGGYACGRPKTQVALRDRPPVSLRPRYQSSRLPTDYVGMAKAPYLPMTLDPVRGMCGRSQRRP
jgi:hypothetical protein